MTKLEELADETGLTTGELLEIWSAHSLACQCRLCEAVDGESD